MKEPIVNIGGTARFGRRVWDCTDVIPVKQDNEEVEFCYVFTGWGDYPIILTEQELITEMGEQV